MLSWSLVLNDLTRFFSSIGLSGIPHQGLIISWWVELMAFMPFGIGISLLGFDSIHPTLVEAGCLLDSDFRVFRKIVLPITMPSIIAGGLFMMLTSLTDYSIPTLFQVNVYSLEIFSEFSASYQASKAFFLSIPLICIMSLTAAIYQSSFSQLVITPLRDTGRNNILLHFPPWFTVLQICAIIIIIMQVMIPLISLIIISGSFNNIVQAVISSFTQIANTVSIALLVALASLPFAIFWAGRVMKNGRWRPSWWIIIILPLILPAPLIGIELVSLWGKSLPSVIMTNLR